MDVILMDFTESAVEAPVLNMLKDGGTWPNSQGVTGPQYEWVFCKTGLAVSGTHRNKQRYGELITGMAFTQ